MPRPGTVFKLYAANTPPAPPYDPCVDNEVRARVCMCVYVCVTVCDCV